MRVAVSFKYGFMAPAVYQSRLRAWVTAEERSEEQLISGWQFLSPATVKRAVALAAGAQPAVDAVALRVGLSEDALARLREELDCEEATAVLAEGVGVGAAGEAGGAFTIPVAALTEAIILSAAKEAAVYARIAFRVHFLVSIFSTFATTVVRASFGSPLLGSSALQLLTIVSHWCANFFTLGVTLVFLTIGAVDHYRRARAFAMLGGLFSLRRGSSSASPILELGSLDNARAFIAARGMLRVFGEGFHERLVLVTSFFLAAFLGVAAYVLVAMFNAPSGGSLSVLLCPFILLHVLVAPAFASILLGLTEAARANEEARKHTVVVVEARLRARMELMRDGGGGERTGQVQRVLPLLEDLECLLRASEAEAAVKILGFEVSGAVAKSFAGAWLSLETACLYQLLSKA